ncbi:MAG: hypothetical protein WBG18_25100, partial [Xanthobacteraceae bacterium]
RMEELLAENRLIHRTRLCCLLPSAARAHRHSRRQAGLKTTARGRQSLARSGTVDICEVCSPATNGGLITGRGHFTDAILRAGLNYQFH